MLVNGHVVVIIGIAVTCAVAWIVLRRICGFAKNSRASWDGRFDADFWFSISGDCHAIFAWRGRGLYRPGFRRYCNSAFLMGNAMGSAPQ